MTTQTTRIERAVYDALRDFQQTADWPQLRLAQMRQHLAEHIARDLTLTPGVLPADPDGISVHDLAHALDNSTPYPVELTPTVTGFMAERLLEMLVIGKRDEHLVWQPEKQPELGTQPQPEEPAVSSAVVAPPTDQAALRDRIAEALLDHLSRTADIRTSSSGGELAFMPEVTDAERMRMADAVLAVLPAPADRAAVLREAADRVDNEELPHDYVDMFDNGARWAARLLRRMADETATEPPQPSLRERHRAAWHALTPDQQTARLAELDEPAAGARQDGAPDDVVTELTEAEFHDAAGKALARLGLTYAELEDQARRRDFSSAQARSLWVTIGGAAPAGARQDGEQQ